MRLAQLRNGYRYNSDTLALYDFTARFIKPYFSIRVLDVGCGCGVLGLLLKRDFSGLNLSLLDVQGVNLAISKHNAALNGIEAKFIEADFAKFKSEHKFELIVSNPPYYHDGVKKSEHTHVAISRYESALNLTALLRSASSNLAPRGELIFCYEAMSLGEVMSALKESKFTPLCLRFVHPKAQSAANLVLVRAKKGSRSKCEILPPLFMHEASGYSPEAQEIFARADTKSENLELNLPKKACNAG